MSQEEVKRKIQELIGKYENAVVSGRLKKYTEEETKTMKPLVREEEKQAKKLRALKARHCRPPQKQGRHTNW